MAPSLADLFPLLYGACFLVLLWQAFRVMGRGFQAIPRPGDPGSGQGNLADPAPSGPDRTGRLTIHPELLDDDGELTREDLLTVRFGGENDHPLRPSDAG
jgi:hypothetical protein